MPHGSRAMDLVVRRALLIACVWPVAATAACSEERHLAPPLPAFHSGDFPTIGGTGATDATVDGATEAASEAAVDAPEDIVRDITWIDADPSCAAFCSCMSTTCASEPSYPFPDELSCESWCSKRSDAERLCFARFCSEASTTKGPAIKTHDCEHAAGAWGLLECM